MSADIYQLERFVDAQEAVYESVVAELQRGRKRTHWMWFVFPQLKGLGQSAMAQRFAISCREEAEAYAAHPILGPRLRACTQLVNAVQGRGVDQIFGFPDDLKFRSCMTLFHRCVPEEKVFGEALEKFFEGESDQRTLDLLETS